ncbi:MAG: hypothetical protein J7L99_01495, partial [Planctomycetes bacterium]|nr:hypothetical protein [Planctomycetota bacterium]
AEHGAWRIEIPFKCQALVLLTATKKGIKPAAIRPAALMETKPGFIFSRGRFRYNLLLGKAKSDLPAIEILQNGKIIETFRLVP